MKSFCLFLFTIGFALSGYSQEADSLDVYKKLKSIKEVPFDNIGDSVYWDLVKGGLNNIPVLIKFLDNTEETDILVMVLNPATIADLAYNIIKDIIYEMPTLELIEEAGGCIKEGYGFNNYVFFLDGNNMNRKRFKEAVKEWYYKNQKNLIWFKTDSHNYSEFQDELNPFKNPAGGYYVVKKQVSKVQSPLNRTAYSAQQAGTGQ